MNERINKRIDEFQTGLTLIIYFNSRSFAHIDDKISFAGPKNSNEKL